MPRPAMFDLLNPFNGAQATDENLKKLTQKNKIKGQKFVLNFLNMIVSSIITIYFVCHVVPLGMKTCHGSTVLFNLEGGDLLLARSKPKGGILPPKLL